MSKDVTILREELEKSILMGEKLTSPELIQTALQLEKLLTEEI